MSEQAGLTPAQMALRALAEQATPGPWTVSANDDGIGILSSEAGWVGEANRDDLHYIAAAHPAAILALLDALTTATARLAEELKARSAAEAHTREVYLELRDANAAFTAMTQERDALAADNDDMQRKLSEAFDDAVLNMVPRAELTVARARAEVLEAALLQIRRSGNTWDCDICIRRINELFPAPPATGHDAGGEVGR
jgi:hypothetical protein